MKEREKNMNYYFAPMEGVTGDVYRNAPHAIFPGRDNILRRLCRRIRTVVLHQEKSGIFYRKITAECMWCHRY